MGNNRLDCSRSSPGRLADCGVEFTRSRSERGSARIRRSGVVHYGDPLVYSAAYPAAHRSNESVGRSRIAEDAEGSELCHLSGDLFRRRHRTAVLLRVDGSVLGGLSDRDLRRQRLRLDDDRPGRGDLRHGVRIVMVT